MRRLTTLTLEIKEGIACLPIQSPMFLAMLLEREAGSIVPERNDAALGCRLFVAPLRMRAYIEWLMLA
jgi:hypothetical protein